jgi:hypothetical protein
MAKKITGTKLQAVADDSRVQIATGFVIPHGAKHLDHSIVLTTTPKHGGLPRK